MKKRVLIYITLLIVMLFSAVVTVSAQDGINVDEMSNEQLMLLLQTIMQKLDAGDEPEAVAEPTETAEALTKISESTETPVPVVSEPEIEEIYFQIYENKKLIVSRIPDDRFIQKPFGGEDSSSESTGKDKKNPKDPHVCEPGCQYECWIDNYGRPQCGCACG